MNKVEIYVATLVAFDRVKRRQLDESGKNILSETLEFTNIKTIDCVIDVIRGNAIDLENGNVYHIIKRDNSGNLTKEEGESLKNSSSGELFVYRYYKKNIKKDSLLYRMYLTDRAQRKYNEYLENIEKEDNVKIKTIKKKDSNFKRESN